MSSEFHEGCNVEQILSQLDLDEKITLLSGKAFFTVNGLERIGIPSLVTADGPHGVRGARSFDPYKSCLLPSATAMGATFDVELLERVGNLLGEECRNKNVHVLLAPTVCLQRSPLIGRGYEAFGEDPVLSGTIAAAYIKGLQDRGVAACIKHYAAHDQSEYSIEDNICMTQRTLRELHLLPFQIAMRKADPWSIMTAYHKINGVHASEDPLLLKTILRDEWKYKGLVMSDWWGTYSTTEAMNAGLDIEMPGPSIYRGRCLAWAVQSRKVRESTVGDSVRNLLNLLKKVVPKEIASQKQDSAADNEENRVLVRRVAAESVVLLKNSRNILPLAKGAGKTFALIGDHFKRPAMGGGGSSEVEAYYKTSPYDAMVTAVGEESVTYAIGAYSFRYSPFLTNLFIPNTNTPGWSIDIFGENPIEVPSTTPVYTATCAKDLIDIPESLVSQFPATYYVLARTHHVPEKSCPFRLGLGVTGKGKLYVNGSEAIDLWTNHPEKTDDTPCFNRLSMERFADIEVAAGKAVELKLLLTNSKIGRAIGTAATLTARLGGFEIIDEDKAISDAAELAKSVDVPIVMTGLSSDYEFEGSDRKTLKLPRRLDELIAATLKANPNTIVVTQSGLPIEMPWVNSTNTLLHAWFGGQETGNGIVDVLFGAINPSARLSVTFPKALRHTPSYLTFGKADHNIMYGEGVFIGHRYYEKLEQEPLFYFGYGLSYSKFEYSNLIVPQTFEGSPDHCVDVAFDITNSGPYAGSEVAQVYVQDVESSVQRPLRELKAFTKVWLEVGERKRLRVSLDRYALSFWEEERGMWKAEKGRFVVVVARSADPRDEVLKGDLLLKDTFFWSGL